METLVVTIMVAVAGSLAAGVAVLARRALTDEYRRRVESWRWAARSAGLSSLELTGEGIAGWAGNVRVQFSRYRGRSNEPGGTRLRLFGPRMIENLAVRPESVTTELRHRTGRHDVETGDAAFDRSVWVTGAEEVALALLDAPTRLALTALVLGQLTRPGRSAFWADGELEGGVLRVDLLEVPPPGGNGLDDPTQPIAPLYLGGTPEHLPEAVQAVVDLARRLEEPSDVPGRLRENLSGEPEAAVRLRLLDVLEARFPAHRHTADAFRSALQDPDANVRLRAAAALGAGTRPVALAVAHGEGATDATSRRAVDALSSSLTVPEASEVLRNALRLRKPETARSCLRILGARGGEEALAMLTRVLAVERGEAGDWAAEALGAAGDPAVGPALVGELSAREEHRRGAAARALGHTGTIAAVPALRRLEESDPRLRRAAREAIARIQARQAGAEPGQLSLAEDATGRLSLSNVEAGRLSLPPDHGGAR